MEKYQWWVVTGCFFALNAYAELPNQQKSIAPVIYPHGVQGSDTRAVVTYQQTPVLTYTGNKSAANIKTREANRLKRFEQSKALDIESREEQMKVLHATIRCMQGARTIAEHKICKAEERTLKAAARQTSSAQRSTLREHLKKEK